MQRLSYIAILLVTILFSCNDGQRSEGDNVPSSSGKYGEVLVVIDTVLEKSISGEALREVFLEALKGLPQNEAQFRMATVPHSGFRSILTRSRNILMLKRKQVAKPSIKLARNVWAKPQLFIEITASKDAEIAALLRKNKQSIRDYFNEEELERLQKQHKIQPQQEFMDLISEKFKVDLTIPPGYVQMKVDSSGLWLKKEKTIGQHQVIQGLAMYSAPYDSEGKFELESVIESRNTFCRDYIQGSRDSSYMLVYEEYQPVVKEINLNGLYAKEFRGLWNMKNDFMGGPFIHYVFVHEGRQEIIHIDGFVFAPKFNKREYLRELEAIIKSLSISKN